MKFFGWTSLRPTCLLLLFVVLLQSVVFAFSIKAPPSQPSPSVVVPTGRKTAARISNSDGKPAFTKNELREHNYVWKIMQKACFGRWSGGLKVFKVDPRTNELVHTDSPDLNIRLFAQKHNRFSDQGTWTVWNLGQLGNEVNIPLRRLPLKTPTQLKIGFESGCVFRVPFNYLKVPRVVVELGFWDRHGDGMRRTVIVEYDSKEDFLLKGVTLVQQTAITRRAKFVGNTTVPKDKHVLPEVAMFQMSDVVSMEELELIQTERVDLQSMTRTTTKRKKLSTKDKEKASAVLECLLSSSHIRNIEEKNLSKVLPNGLCTCIPKQLAPNSCSFVFAHAWSHERPFQAMHLEFDPITSNATSAIMYSYQRRK